MRILEGLYARKFLAIPPSSLTRPTSHKVRGAIFNILANWIDLEGRIVLDAFAGSGALGLEALSRGAKKAYFIEDHPKVLPVLLKNVVHLNVHAETVVLKANALKLKSFPEPCDLIFLDPPYGKDYIGQVLLSLQSAQIFQKKSFVVFESDRRDVWELPSFMHLCVTKTYGDTKVTIAQID